MHQALGIARGIVVQTTTYGADHRVVLDGLAALGPDYKGCANAAVLFESATTPSSSGCMPPACAARASRSPGARRRARAARRSTRGRQAARARLVHEDPARAERASSSSVSWFEHLDLPILIDHMGRPDAAPGPSATRNIVEAARAAEARQLLGDAVARREDLAGRPAVRTTSCRWRARYIDAAPERCVWGSGLAAPGLEEAAAERRRPARAAVPLRAQRCRAAPTSWSTIPARCSVTRTEIRP